jgi:hypothetical protein
MNVLTNPPGRDDLYLECLNSCFPGWGDQRAFEWAFGRTVGGPRVDRMLLTEADEVLAGSAVSYRTLRLADGRSTLVGIMTGSWTLPAARGKGAFTQIVEESVRLTRAHGGALLLAFVTQTNASFRRLEAAGSTLFDTRYLSSQAGVTGAVPTLACREVAAADAPEWFPRFMAARPPGARFDYAAPAEWAGQLLRRPGGTTLFDVETLGAAVVEMHGDFDRLQALAPLHADLRAPLVRYFLERAQSRGRRLFVFESDVARADVLVATGLDAAPGFLTALPADDAAYAALVGAQSLKAVLPGWALDSGDRM